MKQLMYGTHTSLMIQMTNLSESLSVSSFQARTQKQVCYSPSARMRRFVCLSVCVCVDAYSGTTGYEAAH